MSKEKDKPKIAVSNYNLTEINQVEYAKLIKTTIFGESNIMVIGQRGSGKTEIAKAEIKESGFKELYLNLSTFERPDIGGYPKLFNHDSEQKFVEFLYPSFYKNLMESKTKEYVLLLDEVDKVDPSIWAPLLEITQFKTINGVPLPGLKAIIMTGNLLSEGGQKPLPPLLDRAIKFKLKPDFKAFLDHCGSHRLLHPAIAAYLEDHSDKLFGAEDQEENYADPSPRSWVLASKLLTASEEVSNESRYHVKVVAGAVGNQISMEFDNYFTYYQKLKPLIENILNKGFSTDLQNEYRRLSSPSEKLVVSMIICNKVAVILDEIINCKEENKKSPDKKNKVDSISSFLNKEEDKRHNYKNPKTRLLLENAATFFGETNLVNVEHMTVSVRSQITRDRLEKSGLFTKIKPWQQIGKTMLEKLAGVKLS